MGELIFFIIFTIPAIYGVAELIHLIRSHFIAPKTLAPKYLIICLGENSPYEQLAIIAEELFWQGKKYAQNIIAVDCGISRDEYLNCREFCDKNNFIFCNSKELLGYLDVLTGNF